MTKKFIKQLDALETLSSLDFINQTTQVSLLTQQPIYQQILPINYGRKLDYYFKAGMKIQS